MTFKVLNDSFLDSSKVFLCSILSKIPLFYKIDFFWLRAKKKKRWSPKINFELNQKNYLKIFEKHQKIFKIKKPVRLKNILIRQSKPQNYLKKIF